MDIAQAKRHVKDTCTAYLTKDEHGDYVMTGEAQRPLFLVGPPGIGKSAIMAQVADELDIAFVDYSMTHHTRQSALGLPFITQRVYDGQTRDVSEYTMSEIIASVYDAMERTGKREGMLFLDEVNCVSETLEPAMLRFLQNKVFGTCRLPAGWVVVSAGNPVEYNRSARSFDVATLDRMRRIDVEPDYAAWRTWALGHDVHPAILSYLDLKPGDFYRMQTRGQTRDFVTARAWMDLSCAMRVYEADGLNIDANLVCQYVQLPSVASDFTAYVELFARYARAYPIAAMLDGSAHDDAAERLGQAGFDEQLSVCELVLDALAERASSACTQQRTLELVRESLVQAREAAGGVENEAHSCAEALEQRADELAGELATRAAHFAAHPQQRAAQHDAIAELRELASVARTADGTPYAALAERFNGKLHEQQAAEQAAAQAIDNAIRFIVGACGQDNALAALLADITAHEAVSAVIARAGCPAYHEHAEALMLGARVDALSRQLATLDEQLAERDVHES